MVKSGAIESYDLYEVSAQTINSLLREKGNDGRPVIVPNTLLYSGIAKTFAHKYREEAGSAQGFDMENGTKDLRRVNGNFFGNENGEFDEGTLQIINPLLNEKTYDPENDLARDLVGRPYRDMLDDVKKEAIRSIEMCDGR